MSETFLRYLLILQELPEAPTRTNTAKLAERLDQMGQRVTRRTLQRDLEKLSRVLPIECDDGTKPFGWSWRQGALTTLPKIARLLHGHAKHDRSDTDATAASVERSASEAAQVIPLTARGKRR